MALDAWSSAMMKRIFGRESILTPMIKRFVFGERLNEAEEGGQRDTLREPMTEGRGC